ALEYDYSEPVPDLNFLEDDILAVKKINGEHPGSITHTVVAMHSRPYDEQFNNNVAKAFNGYITHYPGMNENDPAYDNTALPEFRCGTRLNAFCVNGHNHNLMVKDIFENGLLYYQCANAGKRQYFVFTINENGYEWENVCF
ncbi:MAG: hypothetical protein K2O12_01195, partial [Muribaculaceae bacterium]|nr:hypothetical protein [Muribaculaceae bacterium]